MKNITCKMKTNQCPNCGYSNKHLELVEWPMWCTSSTKEQCKYRRKDWCVLKCTIDDITRYLAWKMCRDESIPFCKGVPLEFAQELTSIVQKIEDIASRASDVLNEIENESEIEIEIELKRNKT